MKLQICHRPVRYGFLAFVVVLVCAAVRAGGAVAAPSVAETNAGAWSFQSAPALHPLRLRVRASRRGTAPGLVFTDPFKDFAIQSPLVGQPGPLIVDERGNPVWFHPLAASLEATDFQAQRYRGQPVLTWWQGTIAIPPLYTNLPPGSPEPGAAFYIYSDHYRLIRKIVAQNGWTADLHEFTLTPRGTALFIAAKEVPMDLTPYGGSKNGAIEDAEIQEVDLRTGRLVFHWDMLDHVSLREAQVTPPARGVWDPYHVNSIDEDSHGHLLVSARDTWAAYAISRKTGRVIWQLGGKGSTFSVPPQARFYWQHDVRYRAGNQVSIFDDGCCNLPHGKPEHHARGLVVRLDFRHHRALLVRQYEHQPAIYVPTQGNVQYLPGGNVFIGWGQLPYYSQYTASGRLLYEVSMPMADESYRAFTLPWVGAPLYPPSAAVRRLHGKTVVYASWNGATRVAYWQLLGGSGTGKLKIVVGRARRRGFETAIATRAGGPFFQIRALDASGRILKASRIMRLQQTSKLPGGY